VDGEGVRRAAAALTLALALVGCDARAQSGGTGSATPPSPAPLPTASPVPVDIPPGWVPLPAVGDAGLAAAADAARARPIAVRTFGEPSLGCFVTIVEITGTREEHTARVAETFRATLAATAQVDGWTFTDGPTAELSATVTRGTMRGAVRGRLATDATSGVPHGVFAACFYNEREPARCNTACTGLLASLESPRVSP
jgi:hypothetical protein